MDYQAFTDDSLVKMYEGVREALAADEALGGREGFAFARHRRGSFMLRISRPRCSGAE